MPVWARKGAAGARLLLCCLLTPTVGQRALAANADTGALRCTITVWDRNPLPFEPGGVVVHVRNEGATAKTLQWWPVGVSVRDAAGERSEWEWYHRWGEPREVPPPPEATRVVLQPGDVFEQPLFLDYSTYTGEHVFARPGAYEVRGDVGRLHSDPVRVDVRKPEGEDAKAYEALSAKGPEGARGTNPERSLLPVTFLDRLPRMLFEERFARALGAFAAAYPRSAYAAFARVGLAIAWIQGVDGRRDLPRARELLLGVSRESDHRLAARALYYLGIAAQKAGDQKAAKDWYSKALAAKPDPFYAYLADRALKGRPFTNILY